MKKIIAILLLIAMGFSILHAVVVDYNHKNHCEGIEYHDDSSVHLEHDEEIEHHHNGGDVCETHFIFHLPFLVPEQKSFLTTLSLQKKIAYQIYLNDLSPKNSTFRPPII